MAEAAHAVVQRAKDAGVYVFAGGLDDDVEPVVVAIDGSHQRLVSGDQGPERWLHRRGVSPREAALQWAEKIAVACRCGQEIREFMSDPLV